MQTSSLFPCGLSPFIKTSFQEGEYKPIGTDSWFQEMNHHGLVETERNQGVRGEGRPEPGCQPRLAPLPRAWATPFS